MKPELNMRQIVEIARLCHAANRELQIIQNDPNVSLDWRDTDAEIRASAILGVKKALEGQTAEQLHVSWANFKVEQGWKYGPVKDADLKTHPSLVPYSELPASEKLKDFIFQGVVRGYAAAHRPNPVLQTELGQVLSSLRTEDGSTYLLDFDQIDKIARGETLVKTNSPLETEVAHVETLLRSDGSPAITINITNYPLSPSSDDNSNQ